MFIPKHAMRVRTFAALFLCLTLTYSKTVYGAGGPSNSSAKNSQTALAGSIDIGIDIPTQSGDSFLCEPVTQFKAGDKIATAGGGNAIWSILKETVTMAGGSRSYPSIGLVRDSSGKYHTLILSIIKILKN